MNENGNITEQCTDPFIGSSMSVSAVYLYDIQLKFEQEFDPNLNNETSQVYKDTVRNISVAVSIKKKVYVFHFGAHTYYICCCNCAHVCFMV